MVIFVGFFHVVGSFFSSLDPRVDWLIEIFFPGSREGFWSQEFSVTSGVRAFCTLPE